MAAELSCVEAVKARSRQPSKRAVESLACAEDGAVARSSKKSSHHRLYDIEIIEEKDYKVKIHYAGYSAKHDEWIRKSEVAYKPASGFVPSKKLSLLAVLACSIKQKLVPSRKHQDPAVRLQLPFDSDTFQLLQQQGISLGRRRGHQTYAVERYSDLDDLLGERWHIRVTNVNGDFTFAILKTIRFYLIQPRPLLDVDFQKSSTGELEFVPYYTEQEKALVFQFVRGDGNKSKLADFL